MTKILVEIMVSVPTRKSFITSQHRAVISPDKIEEVILLMAQESIENTELIIHGLEDADMLDDEEEDEAPPDDDDDIFRNFINDL